MSIQRSHEQMRKEIEALEREVVLCRKTEEALRKSESRYRRLLDFVPYPLVVFSEDGHVSYLNPGFTEVFGWDHHELHGKMIPFVPEALKHETAQNIRRLNKEKMPLKTPPMRAGLKSVLSEKAMAPNWSCMITVPAYRMMNNPGYLRGFSRHRTPWPIQPKGLLILMPGARARTCCA